MTGVATDPSSSSRRPADDSGRSAGLTQSDPGGRTPTAETPFLPVASLPTGGGAIRGIGETFSLNPATGGGSVSVPVFTTPGRGGPSIAISYSPGVGNSVFGMGWNMTVPSVSRKTDKGLPRYADSDTYVLHGAEDLVPGLIDTGNGPRPDVTVGQRGGRTFSVTRFRPRIEGDFTRVERWQDLVSAEVSWRTVSPTNVTSVYGFTAAARIADPTDPDRVFRWLLEEVSDDLGNVTAYEYKMDDLAGVDPGAASERHHLDGLAPTGNRYLKRVRYANATAGTGDDGWYFLVVFDYGEHDPEAPTPDEVRAWTHRPDPFSGCRSGFEIRTRRLCRRVLVFHDLPAAALGDGPLPRLVRSTDFTYDTDPAGVHLLAAAQTGYDWDPNTRAYAALATPPVGFAYTRSTVDAEVRSADPDTVANLPAGTDGQQYHWVDLDGEGVSGALTRQGEAWWYKRNLGGGRLGALERLPTQPSAGTDSAAVALVDIGGDGSRALLRRGPLLSGFQERVDGAWGPFVAFAETPSVDWNDPALRHVDLDGDGLADLLIADGPVFRWHPSLGRGGYGPQLRAAQSFDEERGPSICRTSAVEQVILADMTGDGLSDLVRIRNGEVCYWPNRGYGRFGAKVTMAGAPRFDRPDQFDPGRIRIGDIDGSGTADLLYIGRSTVTYWINQAGNGYASGVSLPGVPDTDRPAGIELVDLLGTGTSCLVWSSGKPADRRRPLRYIDLCRAVSDWLPPDDPGRAGHKPNLLCSVRNNVGAETRIAYAPSTRFSLADRAAGTPWLTRLPFPVQVVTRVERYDHVAKTSMVTTYRYRHGYYDGPEREFRGFGMVERRDAEEFGADRGAGLFAEPVATQLTRPPVVTRTWMHTGAYFGEQVIADGFRAEYNAGDVLATPLADSVEPDDLSADEARQSRRALAGRPLRVEVYADDGDPAAANPYVVTEHRYRVHCDQHATATRPGVFRSHALETLTYQYERDPADPRIGHELVIEVDDYNTVRQGVTIGYPRRIPAQPEQGKQLITWTVTDVAHTVGGTGDPYRLATPIERVVYELTGLDAPVSGGRYALDEIGTALAGYTPSWDIGYEVTAASVGHPQRRAIEHTRTVYWSDDLTAGLPLGQPGARALVHESYRLALTPGLLAAAYGDRVDPGVLTTEGGYAAMDGAWWIPSGVRFHDPAAFFSPHQLRDPFGTVSGVAYDAYRLMPLTSYASQLAPFDVLVTTVQPDYRLMTVGQLTDPNGNRSSVRSDPLGRVTAAWTQGKDGGTDGDPADLPGIVYSYDASSWYHGTGPAWARTERRERHGDAASPWQRARGFSDGSGRVVLTKVQSTPGLAWQLNAQNTPERVDTGSGVRWIGSGRVVMDIKGKPVKQYEPYFTTSDAYDDEDAIVMQGVTPVLHYDPVGRLIRTEMPDGTLTRVVFDGWQQQAWDQTDTVLESRWYADRGSPDPTAEPEPADPRRRAAWLAASAANTPSITHTDSLGRAAVSIADGGSLGTFTTRTALDVEGNALSVTDARGVVVQRQDYDMAGRVLHTAGPDAGDRWTLPDVTGHSIRAWDGRGYAFRYTFDALRRPAATYVTRPGIAGELLSTLVFHGETHPDALSLNLRGRVYVTFDGAGASTISGYDFKGNPVSGTRTLALAIHDAPDWSALAGATLTSLPTLAAPLTGPESFDTSTDRDALNRTIRQTQPDGTVIAPGYGTGGMLATVTVTLPGDAAGQFYVTDLDYDAKGQRTTIGYGNGVRTTYAYDPLTYRLTGLTSVRGGSDLQDLGYTYDPGGNIVEIGDGAQQTVFFAGQVVTPTTRYAYDALHRLTTATGREHANLGAQPDAADPAVMPLPHPNDAQALRLYTEQYTYDDVGNILAMIHQAGPTGSWTRTCAYADDSNRLLSHNQAGSPTPAVFTYDPHGNMTAMPHLASLGWDHADHLSTVDLGGGGTAYYAYDASGQRVRKVIERLGGLVEERIYLGGYESHRRTLNGSVTFRRDTVHIMDDARRIAMVETKTVDTSPGADVPEVRVRYQLSNHLGSSVLEVDDTATVISYEEFHPYGTTSLRLATGAAEVSAKRYRYTGKEKDDETLLYYHGARYYACWLGRWTAADPAGLVDGTNRYAYARCRPVVMSDPTGKWGLDMHFGAVYWSGRLAGATHEEALNAAIASQAMDDFTYRDAVSVKVGAILAAVSATNQSAFHNPDLNKSNMMDRYANNAHALNVTRTQSESVAHAGINEHNITLFGLGMHPVGDFLPHASETEFPTFGHQIGLNEDQSGSGPEIHDADHTSKNPQKALATFVRFTQLWSNYLKKSSTFPTDPGTIAKIATFLYAYEHEKEAALHDGLADIDKDPAHVDEVIYLMQHPEARRARFLATLQTSAGAHADARANEIWLSQPNDSTFFSRATDVKEITSRNPSMPTNARFEATKAENIERKRIHDQMPINDCSIGF
jgi:RHS repeat-associated protein